MSSRNNPAVGRMGHSGNLRVGSPRARPKIVTLCGSTRFWQAFQQQSLRLTMDGVIVLSIGCATASDEEHGITPKQKARLDALHKEKINLSDEVLVLNVGGYIGESTASEIAHAELRGKTVRYLEPVSASGVTPEEPKP
jgi:hypothetical protein